MHKMVFKQVTFILIGSLVACSQNGEQANSSKDEHAHEEQGDHHDQEAEKDPHGHEAEKQVELTKAQLDKGDIRLGQFNSMNLKSTVQATGRLAIPPQNKANVGAMMPGMVKDIQVLPGEFVKKGQVLAFLNDPEFAKLQQDYLSSKSQLAYIKEEYQRKKELYNNDVGSEREFQKIQSEYRSLKAKVNALASQLRSINIQPKSLETGDISEKIAIRAPIEGFIKNIHIKMGQYVSSNETLFELVDNHHMHIDLMVYEKDVPKVHKGQDVIFKMANREDPQPMMAQIFATGKALENEEKAVRMHAELKNRYDHLLPGMYVEARIITDTTSGKTLPESGVVMDKDHQFIFYSTANKEADHMTFQRVEVESGPTDGGYTQVKLGKQNIPAKARLVTHNAHYLLRQMQTGSGGGHSH